MGIVRDIVGRIEEAAKDAPREVVRALIPQMKRVKEAVAAWDMGDPSDEPDARLAADVWETARHAGWSAEDVVANPREAVRDVLAIWKSK